MAHIPMDDTDILWQETADKSWGGLEKTLQTHKGKTNGISDELVGMMIDEAKKMESSGTPFPDSPKKLNEVLNQNLPQGK